MTVQELIEELRKMPFNAPVVYEDAEGNYVDIETVDEPLEKGGSVVLLP